MIVLIKRIVVIFMAVLSFVNANGTEKYGDYCGNFDFPRISAEKQGDDSLRIMSFNIRCGDVNGAHVPERIDIAIRQIKEIMPDSLGIQEATPEWMKALDKKLTLYDWVGLDREKGVSPLENGESCPIFYLKAKFSLEDSGNFWISDTPDVPSKGPGAACIRICTWAKLKDRITGKVFIHVNTHYDHVSEEARVQGALIVTRFIEENFKGIPVVFTADMNTSEKGEAYATMTANLTDARFAAQDCKTYGTFHGGKNPADKSDYYIDFILCSDNFEVASYRTVTQGVDNRFTSDHFPIYADLVLSNKT
ncbi:MAG: endonuclease/exonuclease/phosphatase family protein [Clostridia bacterium]|nr:endonuclease/exonuclease/phosphatase family protein [Clostridia bacterium]